MSSGKRSLSDEDQESREWSFYVTDMIQFAEKVMAYTRGMDQARFIADTRTYDATLRNLELIGEAATRIPIAIRDTHSDIPWRAIVGTRNRLTHGYMRVDDDLIWDIIQNDVPTLLPALRNLLDAMCRGAD